MLTFLGVLLILLHIEGEGSEHLRTTHHQLGAFVVVLLAVHVLWANKRPHAPAAGETAADIPGRNLWENAHRIVATVLLLGSAWQVRGHSFAVERCGPHIAISPAMLRSSDHCSAAGLWQFQSGHAIQHSEGNSQIAKQFGLYAKDPCQVHSLSNPCC